ncbi:MAG: IgGFc-binding protein [Labilithrix sp.]|nr:IgGFc-binding protein [Labilithrix sp.]
MKTGTTLWIVTPLVAVALAVACTTERDAFSTPPTTVLPGDDGGLDAGEECRVQCSLDGRAIVDACTGEIVETCRPELACGEAVCQEPCAAAAADRRSDGCDFYFQSPRFYRKNDLPQSCHAAFVVNTSTQPAELALELEGQVLDISKSLFRTNPGDATLVPHTGLLAPGESAILFVADRDPNAPQYSGVPVPCPSGTVAAAYVDGLPSGNGLGSAFRLRSSVPVAATSIYPFGGAKSYLPSATLLLPVPTWSTQHLLVNAWEASRSGVPSAHIVAAEDGTEVTILPKKDIADGTGVTGALAGKPATYTLARGQILQLAQYEELSGSVVTSNKPTTIFGSHSCAEVPTTSSACDTLHQQIPGYEHWGSEYVGVGYRPRLGNEHELVGYRVVAARDGTRLDYDPAPPAGAPVTLSAGEVAFFAHGTSDAFVVRTQDAEHPIFVAMYMSGCVQGFSGPAGGDSNFIDHGDPEFVNVVPAGQYLSSYSFYADPTYRDTSLVVVRAKTRGKFHDVSIECAGALGDFQPIGARGEYEFARVDLGTRGKPGQTSDAGVCWSGLHRMRSDGPFTATLWGWDRAASYAYPGGLAQRKLVTIPLAPIQ